MSSTRNVGSHHGWERGTCRATIKRHTDLTLTKASSTSRMCDSNKFPQGKLQTTKHVEIKQANPANTKISRKVLAFLQILPDSEGSPGNLATLCARIFTRFGVRTVFKYSCHLHKSHVLHADETWQSCTTTHGFTNVRNGAWLFPDLNTSHVDCKNKFCSGVACRAHSVGFGFRVQV